MSYVPCLSAYGTHLHTVEHLDEGLEPERSEVVDRNAREVLDGQCNQFFSPDCDGADRGTRRYVATV